MNVQALSGFPRWEGQALALLHGQRSEGGEPLTFDALNRRTVEKLRKPLTRAIDPRLDRLDRNAQYVSRLLLGEVVEVGQEQGLLELDR